MVIGQKPKFIQRKIYKNIFFLDLRLCRQSAGTGVARVIIIINITVIVIVINNIITIVFINIIITAYTIVFITINLLAI